MLAKGEEAVKNTVAECKHRPEFKLNYGGPKKVHVCKYCGKRIIVDHSIDFTFHFLLGFLTFGILGLVFELLQIRSMIGYIIGMLGAVLILLFVGAFVFCNFLPFHIVDDGPEAKQGNEREKEPMPDQASETKDQ